MFRHTAYIRELRRAIPKGGQARVARYAVEDVAPHFWREEAPTIGEWFKNNTGAFDLDVTELVETGDFIVRHRTAQPCSPRTEFNPKPEAKDGGH